MIPILYQKQIQKKLKREKQRFLPWLFQSIGIMRDFIFFFVLCFLFFIFRLSTYYIPNCSAFGLFQPPLLEVMVCWTSLYINMCVYLSIHVKWNLESWGMPAGHVSLALKFLAYKWKGTWTLEPDSLCLNMNSTTT